MQILKNKRHELFAKGLADGLKQEAAYIAAGYSPNGASGGASNLISRPLNNLRPLIRQENK